MMTFESLMIDLEENSNALSEGTDSPLALYIVKPAQHTNCVQARKDESYLEAMGRWHHRRARRKRRRRDM